MITEQDVIDCLKQNGFQKIGSDGEDYVYRLTEPIHTSVTILIMTGIHKDDDCFIDEENPSCTIIFFDTKSNVLIGKSTRRWYWNKRGDDVWYTEIIESIKHYTGIAVDDKLFTCADCGEFLRFISTPKKERDFWGCSSHKTTGCDYKFYPDDYPKRNRSSRLPENIYLKT